MLEFLKRHRTNPILQLGLILLLMLVFMTIAQLTNIETSQYNTGAWEVMAAFVLFYTLVNCVFSLQSKDIMTYFRNSVFCFIGLLVLGSGLAYLFSGVSLNEAGSMKWILMVFSIGYLVFLSIVNLMRFIVELAQRQDKRLRGEE